MPTPDVDHELIQLFRSRLWRPGSLLPSEFAPSYVYHYTTVAGFAGILSSGAIRATNFSFLNDPSELRYGRQLALEVLGDVFDAAKEEMAKLLGLLVEAFKREAIAEVYVACFTRLPDDLSQWRAYGSSAIERYALGFEAEALGSIQAANTSFAKVLYRKADQVDRIRFFVDRAIAFVEREDIDPSRWSTLAAVVAQLIARVLPELKDPAYKREEEWRIIRWHDASNDEAPDFDITRGVLRPFMPIHLPVPVPLSSLRVMAPSRKRAALKAADMLLRKAKIADVEAEHSSVPFAE
jgi:hypothetical protein